MGMRRWVMIVLTMICGVSLCIGLVTTTAQNDSITPEEPLAFATNTPRPDLTALAPGAPFERYALRQWDEPALLTLLTQTIQQLSDGDTERQYAVRLLQHELARRFPGAPHDEAARDALLAQMLLAPRGSVDMRTVVRSYAASFLNRERPSLEESASFDSDGFNITIIPANLNGDDTPDALIQIRYPGLVSDPADLLYQDFVAVIPDAAGNYIVREGAPMFPAAPLYDVQNISLERIGDLNQDGVAEIALSVDRGEVNHELMIFGWRNGAISSLVAPGAHILFGGIADWPFGGTSITVREFRVESPAWGCLGEREIRWVWANNFFRPPAEAQSYTFQNRIACRLLESEPIFERPVDQAISTIESIVQQAQPDDEFTVQRAAMVLAMLKVLNGNVNEAIDQVRGLQTSAEPGSWLAGQTTTFLNTTTQSDGTPLLLCAALQEADPYGACDVAGVLTRLFTEQPLSRNEPISTQLARLGITVEDTVTIAEIGRLNREAIHFRLAGDHWWAFAPLEEDTYTAEKIDPPPGYELPAAPLPRFITPPDMAYQALLVNNNPTESLNILDNATRDNPGATLASSTQFLQALCYDLLADRNNARRTYFAAWASDPASVWGQLAASHLEQR
jgi:hypothetical protein